MKAFKFTISGDFITEFSRTRFLESRDITVGMDVLVKSLPGISSNIARQVVLGKKRLVGENQVTLEDDDVKVVPDKWLCKRPIEKCACGWLSPSGEVYGFEQYGDECCHHVLAKSLVNLGVVEYLPDGITFERSVELAGFIKFSPELVVAVCSPTMITEEQRDAVLRYMDSWGRMSIQVGYCSCGLTKRSFISNSELLQFANRLVD